MSDRRGPPLPTDPYRETVGDATYKRSSRFARASRVLSRVGVLLVGLVFPFSCGALADELPLLAAVITYALGIALIFAPAVARARLGRSPNLAPEPSLMETSLDPERVQIGGLKFTLVCFMGFALIASYAMLHARSSFSPTTGQERGKTVP